MKPFKVYEDVFRQRVQNGLINAVIFDVDGTLAHMNGRSPYEDRKSKSDMPDFAVMMMAKALAIAYPGLHILVVSGRNDVSKYETEQFLAEFDVSYDDIFMRVTGDYRKDSIVKEEIYRKYIAPHYNVLAVFDDREQVVDMWRGLGLKVFQVDPGKF